jgi:hypothetical protein
MQTVHGTEGHMAVYGPVCHPQNIMKPEAEGHIMFWGDRPVHKLPFGQKCHELFVILYTTDQNYSNQNTIGCIIWTLLIHILIHMYIEQM